MSQSRGPRICGRQSGRFDVNKILVLHNRYKTPGGEDAVVRAEVALLRARGHVVNVYDVSNTDVNGRVHAGFVGLAAAYSITARLRMRQLIKRDRPDIVHVHNFFPQLTPSVFHIWWPASTVLLV